MHYLDIKRLDFRSENNNTPGILIKEIRYTYQHINLGFFELQHIYYHTVKNFGSKNVWQVEVHLQLNLISHVFKCQSMDTHSCCIQIHILKD